MRQIGIGCLCVIGFMVCFPTTVASDSMASFVRSFQEQYSALVPEAGSSVNSDYKLSQVALGSKYSVELLAQIVRQNQEMIKKYDEMLQNYQMIIRQNQKLESILAEIADQIKSTSANTTETAPTRMQTQ